jgi:hypothetical protein
MQAFVVLKEGFEGTDELKKEIQTFVKTRLAAHEYPLAFEATVLISFPRSIFILTSASPHRLFASFPFSRSRSVSIPI